jgi:hypothetical protein
MGAPAPNVKVGDQPAAETLLSAFRTIPAAERRRHASVLNYWLSIRGDKEFPPLHDLDPLELSDAGPNSILFELISGGHDAEIRHMGEALREGEWPERILDAESNSVLACIAKKLPIVAISRDFLAFEDEFASGSGKTRCWVTLLPLSAGGAWVDYVYALVSTDAAAAKGAKPAEAPAKKAKDPEPEVVEEAVAQVGEPAAEQPVTAEDEPGIAAEEPVVAEIEQAEPAELSDEETAEIEEPASATVAKAAPGFSKLLDSLAGLTGFYGSNPVKVEPVTRDSDRGEDAAADGSGEMAEQPVEEEIERVADEPVVEEAPVEVPVAEEAIAEEAIAEEPEAEEPVAEQAPVSAPAKQPQSAALEGSLQTKLTDVRARADEARQARLRANSALIDGLSAAYDFALDAEDAPEEYLKLVEAQGLKIQLRAPMKPVVKLAFDGLADGATISELETVLAWALKQDMPRGALADRIHEAGGLDKVLSGARAA